VCIIRTPIFQCSRNAKIYNPMCNTHLEFHSRPDPSASVRLAAVLDRSAGQQWSVYLVALAHSVRILTRLFHAAVFVKFDALGGPVIACIHCIYTRGMEPYIIAGASI